MNNSIFEQVHGVTVDGWLSRVRENPLKVRTPKGQEARVMDDSPGQVIT